MKFHYALIALQWARLYQWEADNETPFSGTLPEDAVLKPSNFRGAWKLNEWTQGTIHGGKQEKEEKLFNKSGILAGLWRIMKKHHMCTSSNFRSPVGNLARTLMIGTALIIFFKPFTAALLFFIPQQSSSIHSISVSLHDSFFFLFFLDIVHQHTLKVELFKSRLIYDKGLLKQGWF